MQTIEHAPTENDQLTNYVGMIFLHSENRPTGDFVVPSSEERKVADSDKIICNAGWTLPIHAFSFRNPTPSKRIEKDITKI